jgi:hypothetical protein
MFYPFDGHLSLWLLITNCIIINIVLELITSVFTKKIGINFEMGMVKGRGFYDFPLNIEVKK